MNRGRGSSLVHQLTERLFHSPVTTVTAMAKEFGRTFAGTQNAMNRLVEFNIVEETRSSPSRLYIAWEIIRALDE